MKDWGIEITYEPDELEAKILKRPAIQNNNGDARALDDLYFLERACELQVLAMSTGKPLKKVSPNMAAHASAGFGRNNGSGHGEAHFAALKRLLDAEQPGYAM